MNSFSVIGNLGKDPERKVFNDRSGNERNYVTFSVADRQIGKDKPPLWWYCRVWGKQGDSAMAYLKKGSKVYVRGTLSGNTDQDGKTWWTLNVDGWEFGNSKEDSGVQRRHRPDPDEVPPPETPEDDDVPF